MKKLILSAYKNPAIRSMVLSYGLAFGKELLVTGYKKYQNSKQVELQVDNYDDYFKIMLNWAIDKGILTDLSTIRLKSNLGSEDYSFPEGKHSVMINGKRALIKLEKKITEYDVREILTITIYKGKQKDLYTIIEEAKALDNISDNIKINSFQDGYWSRLKSKGVRLASTYVLKKGQKERILDDIEWFYNNRKWYVDRGIPYHRGYLFSGPPGTGKTTLINVIASKFHKPVYILNLSAIADDKELMKCISNIDADAIVALEDIDCIIASHDREEENKVERKGVTLAGILNCLDGVLTPDGVVFILTTNYPEKLDNALVRPGRVDVHEVLDFLEKEEQFELSRLFFDTDVGIDKPVGAATLQGIFMKHLDDPASAQKELDSLNEN